MILNSSATRRRRGDLLLRETLQPREGTRGYVTISFASRVVVCPETVFRSIGDEALALNAKTQSYMGLNAIATQMWTALIQAPSIQHAYEALLAEYDVGAGRLCTDLQEFLEELKKNGLIDIRSNS